MAFIYSDITNKSELAMFLNIPLKKLTYMLYVVKPENCYTSFEIPKSNGGTRLINAPTEELKSLQRRLAQGLWAHQQRIWKLKGISPNVSHAFEKKKSIITNARIHRNKRYILNLDLKDFFDSFHFGRVRGFFIANKDFMLPTEVATIIAQLVCYKQRLPQGAPTSPIITNLICQIFDYHVLKVAKKYKLDYSRYADDLTFSTNDKHYLGNRDYFLSELTKTIEAAGFSINDTKTRLVYKDSQQKVTGLVVNKRVNVDREYFRQTKAMAHSLYANGSFKINGIEGSLSQLEGRFSFINQLDRYNNKIDKALYYSNQKINNQLDRYSSRINIEKHHFNNLNGRERQYQEFIFYKYFYGNSKPLIVTEGKTDVVYLKCALKNLHTRYPELITKKPDGSFSLRIAFLKRTDRLDYFLDFTKDGADAMKKIYNLFIDGNNSPNYYSCLRRLSKPKNPVFFIFDNEIATKGKPLKTFASYASLSKQQESIIIGDNLLPLIDDGNLFVLTNQLVDGKTECEIEELFDKATLAHTINGKSFSLEKDAGMNGHYGKDTFSKYIASNYQNIDFTNFMPMLDKLSESIKSFADQLASSTLEG